MHQCCRCGADGALDVLNNDAYDVHYKDAVYNVTFAQNSSHTPIFHTRENAKDQSSFTVHAPEPL